MGGEVPENPIDTVIHVIHHMVTCHHVDAHIGTTGEQVHEGIDVLGEQWQQLAKQRELATNIVQGALYRYQPPLYLGAVLLVWLVTCAICVSVDFTLSMSLLVLVHTVYHRDALSGLWPAGFHDRTIVIVCNGMVGLVYD